MKRSLLVTAAALSLEVANLCAASIQTFNTGLGPNGSVDPHYDVFSSPSSSSPASAFIVLSNAFPIPPWIPDGPNSQWIAPQVSSEGPGGNYDYQTTFDLTGFDPTTAELVGQWASDNAGLDILINGASTGNTIAFGSNPNFSFTQFTPFTITSGFQAGINTLDFLVNNSGTSPTGVRVEYSGTASATPEPGCFVLMFGAIGFLGVTKKRLRQALGNGIGRC